MGPFQNEANYDLNVIDLRGEATHRSSDQADRCQSEPGRSRQSQAGQKGDLVVGGAGFANINGNMGGDGSRPSGRLGFMPMTSSFVTF